MDTFFSRYKDLLVLFAVLFAQFIGLATQIRHPLPDGKDRHNVRLWRYWVVALVAPPEKILHSIGSGTRSMWDNYIDLRHTREENQRLLAEVNRLHLEQAGLIEDAHQGQRLQSLLSFKEHYVYQTQPAEVIGTAGTDQSRILYINKGSKDGLAPDMPVITPDGVVGRLKDVFPHTSQVLAINDQTSGAGVLLESTRLRGVLRGNVYGQPQIINILPDERIKPGEPVVTSGGDQIYPRGLPVGTVESVVSDPSNDPYVDVIVKPAANLSHLEEVLVVTQVSDQMPPAAQRDIAKSEADGAVEAEKERASDILAEKLPSAIDPDAPADASPTPSISSDAELLRPIKPLIALHPDRYSPSTTPPASSLTPGGHITSIDRSAALNTATSRPHPAVSSDDTAATDDTATPPPAHKSAPRKPAAPANSDDEPPSIPAKPASVNQPPSTPQASNQIDPMNGGLT
jgi:rod shape-determining protein MreC